MRFLSPHDYVRSGLGPSETLAPEVQAHHLKGPLSERNIPFWSLDFKPSSASAMAPPGFEGQQRLFEAFGHEDGVKALEHR